jgi:[acyl-carrier-protein] S-malonyltransferase
MTVALGSLIFMFPGQSSRHPDMIEKVTSEWPQSAAIVAHASDLLRRDIAAHFRSDNPNIFAHNRDVQIGVFITNHIHMKRLEEAGVVGRWSLGLSLGEYNHLVHAGALTFEAALLLIDERGRLFDKGPPGVMASLFPIEADNVERKIVELNASGRVVISLYNAPRQQVVSGDRRAVAQLVAALEEETLIEVTEIEPKIPIHSPAFESVAKKFREVLARTPITTPRLPYLSNVTGVPAVNPSPDQIRGNLALHICEPVRWRDSIDALAEHLPDAHVLEVGPRAVLYNMFGRGWNPGRRSKADNGHNWREHIKRLTAELRHEF